MEDNGLFWNWYEGFWKVWGMFIGSMVISRLLRGQGLYPGSPDSSLLIFNVMYSVIQVQCVILLPLLLFEFTKGLDKKRRERK